VCLSKTLKATDKKNTSLSHKLSNFQRVETNTSNVTLWTSVSPPHGTTLTAFADAKYGCCQMLDGLISTHPPHFPLIEVLKYRPPAVFQYVHLEKGRPWVT